MEEYVAAPVNELEKGAHEFTLEAGCNMQVLHFGLEGSRMGRTVVTTRIAGLFKACGLRVEANVACHLIAHYLIAG